MTEADFVVVGGGVHGCAVAYHLAKSGESVLVVEAGEIAQGASGGRGKRGVRANYRDLRELPLMAEAYECWQRLAEELEGETGYECRGGIYLIEREENGLSRGLATAKERAQAQQRLGVPTEVWSAQRLRKALPGVSSEVVAGVYAAGDGVASHAETTRSYARAAEQYGAELYENRAVVDLVRDRHSRVVGVETHAGEVFAARRGVLLAANAGTADLVASSLGVQLPLWNIYPQVLFLAARNLDPTPFLLGHDSRTLSVKVLENQMIMLSGGWRGKLDPATGKGVLLEDQIRGNISELRATFPHIGELQLHSAYADRAEAISIDEIPLIGALTNGLYIAAGWSAHGWALVPAVSKHVSAMMRTGRASRPLRPFSPERFKLPRIS